MPMRGKGAGVFVGGTGVESEAMRVALAIEIALDTPEGKSDDGVQFANTVAEAVATNTTMPIWRKARKRGEGASEEVIWLHQTLRVSKGLSGAKCTRIFDSEQESCQKQTGPLA